MENNEGSGRRVKLRCDALRDGISARSHDSNPLQIHIFHVFEVDEQRASESSVMLGVFRVQRSSSEGVRIIKSFLFVYFWAEVALRIP